MMTMLFADFIATALHAIFTTFESAFDISLSPHRHFSAAASAFGIEHRPAVSRLVAGVVAFSRFHDATTTSQRPLDQPTYGLAPMPFA